MKKPPFVIVVSAVLMLLVGCSERVSERTFTLTIEEPTEERQKLRTVILSDAPGRVTATVDLSSEDPHAVDAPRVVNDVIYLRDGRGSASFQVGELPMGIYTLTARLVDHPASEAALTFHLNGSGRSRAMRLARNWAGTNIHPGGQVSLDVWTKNLGPPRPGSDTDRTETRQLYYFPEADITVTVDRARNRVESWSARDERAVAEAADRARRTADHSSRAVEVTIVGGPARICPVIQCGQDEGQLTRIPAGTKVEVLETRALDTRAMTGTILWFRINYKGRTGWISEMTTDKAKRWENGRWVRD